MGLVCSGDYSELQLSNEDEPLYARIEEMMGDVLPTFFENAHRVDIYESTSASFSGEL